MQAFWVLFFLVIVFLVRMESGVGGGSVTEHVRMGIKPDICCRIKAASTWTGDKKLDGNSFSTAKQLKLGG